MSLNYTADAAPPLTYGVEASQPIYTSLLVASSQVLRAAVNGYLYAVDADSPSVTFVSVAGTPGTPGANGINGINGINGAQGPPGTLPDVLDGGNF